MDIDWVQFLTDPVTLASALACVATFATVMTLAAPAFGNDRLTNRLKTVANRREELRKRSRAALEGAEKKSIRVRDTSALKKVVDKLRQQIAKRTQKRVLRWKTELSLRSSS